MNKLKQTKGRQIVLDALKKSKTPLTAQEILSKINKQIDQATVYRILNIFETNEVVFSDLLDNEKRYYIADKQHHHIICKLCKKVKCIPCSHALPKVPGFKNIKHNMYLIGICNNCK